MAQILQVVEHGDPVTQFQGPESHFPDPQKGGILLLSRPRDPVSLKFGGVDFSEAGAAQPRLGREEGFCTRFLAIGNSGDLHTSVQ